MIVQNRRFEADLLDYCFGLLILWFINMIEKGRTLLYLDS